MLFKKYFENKENKEKKQNLRIEFLFEKLGKLINEKNVLFVFEKLPTLFSFLLKKNPAFQPFISALDIFTQIAVPVYKKYKNTPSFHNQNKPEELQNELLTDLENHLFQELEKALKTPPTKKSAFNFCKRFCIL